MKVLWIGKRGYDLEVRVKYGERIYDGYLKEVKEAKKKDE